MINIIPNWHPLLVHFTIVFVIGLAAVQILNWLMPHSYKKLITPSLHSLLVVLTLLSVLLTVWAGFVAYNSVAHDTPSHLAMTNHKHWAIATSVVSVLAGVFYFVLPKLKHWLAGGLFVVAAGLVAVTGFKGGELVYKHGLGVLSLPKTDDHNHADGHHDGAHGHHDGAHGHHANADEHHSQHDKHHSGGHHDKAHHGADDTPPQTQLNDAPKTHKNQHIHPDGKVHQH